ncbi:sugar O-acetyltransferase [Pedobacter changchengzhani]|uniref:Acetyltransferase n=1 Tax=Pedobacter changchengzhani TaxID=2529274 RepID=A0A4R5MPT1_9SPHI|nr:sugar O-acetyltransferase [Pedobacter changchengzhani]TDG37832.1 sugar O-acetyltransferase [Pedobacter changchengzhani]
MLTEKQKMLAGKAYHAGDSELSKERLKAREIVFEFNNLAPKFFKQRKDLLKRLFGKTERMFYVEPPFRCDYGYNIEIGDNFYANFNLVILDCAKVSIGDNVFIAPNVAIYTAGHPLHAHLRDQHVEWAQPVTIGNSVWIGGNVVINAGVKIGSNVVIGSGSVVTKDIPDNMLAFGNPCKVVREITDEDKEYYYKNFKIEE